MSTSAILLVLGGLGAVGAGYYFLVYKPKAGAPVPAAVTPPTNVGYQGDTQQANVYSMLGKAFEGAGTAAGSWLGSGFNSGTQEGGTYGAGGDFYGWDY